MKAVLQKFFICCDYVSDLYIDYILHTQKPRVVFKVIKTADRKFAELELAQEIDSISDLTPESLNTLLLEMKQFYLDYENEMDTPRPYFIIDEIFESAKTIPLEDAYTLSILNNKTSQVPSNTVLKRLTKNNLIKIGIDNEMFWFTIKIVCRRRNKIIIKIEEELPFLDKYELKIGDIIIIEPQHIFEIKK